VRWKGLLGIWKVLFLFLSFSGKLCVEVGFRTANECSTGLARESIDEYLF